MGGDRGHTGGTPEGGDLRGWPYTLVWSDFTSVPNPGPRQLVALNGRPIVARVSVSILFYADRSMIVPVPGMFTEFRFGSVDVAVERNRAQMQVVPSRIPRGREAHYLRHEQGHLDLMGLFARELEGKLMRLRAGDSNHLVNAANALVDEVVRSAQMYAINPPHQDCIYDRETRHGQLGPKQDLWNRKIAQNIARCQDPAFTVGM